MSDAKHAARDAVIGGMASETVAARLYVYIQSVEERLAAIEKPKDWTINGAKVDPYFEPFLEKAFAQGRRAGLEEAAGIADASAKRWLNTGSSSAEDRAGVVSAVAGYIREHKPDEERPFLQYTAADIDVIRANERVAVLEEVAVLCNEHHKRFVELEQQYADAGQVKQCDCAADARNVMCDLAQQIRKRKLKVEGIQPTLKVEEVEYTPLQGAMLRATVDAAAVGREAAVKLTHNDALDKVIRAIEGLKL